MVQGQELAVIEAMKMQVGVEEGCSVVQVVTLTLLWLYTPVQNILRASKNAVVKAVHVKAGSNLKNDQTILEYEP